MGPRIFSQVDAGGHEILVLDGYRQQNPMPSSNHPAEPDVPKGYERMMVYTDFSAMRPQLWRWRLRSDDGVNERGTLGRGFGADHGIRNDQPGSTPDGSIAMSTVHGPNLVGFSLLASRSTTWRRGSQWTTTTGPDRFGSEAPFVPRIGAKSEDDGYIVTFVTDMVADQSELVILDALQLDQGPVCRLKLPHRISSGTHSTWASLSGPTAKL